MIVNIIGAAGEIADSNYIVGATGNAALIAFTRALGATSLDNGVRVNGINPGPVETDRLVMLLKNRALQKFNDESRWGEFCAHFPLGRSASVDEIAAATVFLASPLSNYTSGATLTIDGGLSKRVLS